MSNLSKTNICWKIRDTVTGLFWNGYSNGCNHEIGTRFDRRSTLDDTVSSIIKRDGKFPAVWEVLEVQISETVVSAMSGADTRIDAMIEGNLDKILGERFYPTSRQVISGWKLFRRMRRKGEFEAWPFIALRSDNYAKSWNVFRARMEELGVPATDRMSREENGWVLFKNKEAAVMARFADTLKGLGEVAELRLAFAQKIGVPVDNI